MVFSSSTFLFAFLPAFLALYFVFPWRAWRNVWLLAASLVFCAWGEPVYVWLMVGAIIVNWLFGLVIGKARGKAAHHFVMAMAFAAKLGNGAYAASKPAF